MKSTIDYRERVFLFSISVHWENNSTLLLYYIIINASHDGRESERTLILYPYSDKNKSIQQNEHSYFISNVNYQSMAIKDK